METRKINLNRKPLDTDYIQSKENFQDILANYKAHSIPVWKKPLFYGAIGLSSIALIVSVSFLDLEQQKQTKDVSDQVVQNPEEKGTSLVVKTASVTEPTISQKILVASSAKTKRDNSIEQECYTKKQETFIVSPEQEVSSSIAVATPIKKKSKIPSIAGVYKGNISVEQLCNDPFLRFDDEQLTVQSFKFQCTGENDGLMLTVMGNKLPEKVCETLKKEGAGQLVFITEIIGSEQESKFVAPSLNLQLIANK